jgi:serine protease Do/serine protease DegQ
MLCAGGAGAETALQDADSNRPSLAPMLREILPAVVSIGVSGNLPDDQSPLLSDPLLRRYLGLPDIPSAEERRFQSFGAGVIVDASKGHILTSGHLVDGAGEITVALNDGRRLKADRIGSDRQTDLALIRVSATGLVQLPLGDSDVVRVGDYVVAVGNPYGLAQTVTSGIVSALGRSGVLRDSYEDFIQTDAAINPGNSGGPLLSLSGELIAINTAIIERSERNVGIGFAIPINLARRIMGQLLIYGEVRRGELGISMQDLSPDLVRMMKLAVDEGVLVAHVIPDSGARTAGLQVGDVIVGLNGKPVRTASELANRIGLLASDASVDLEVVRQGQRKHLLAELTSKTQDLPRLDEHPLLAGIRFGAIDYQSPACGRLEAVVLVEVDKNSLAAKEGLEPGDIILDVNQRPVHTPAELMAIARPSTEELLLHVMRSDKSVFLVLRSEAIP